MLFCAEDAAAAGDEDDSEALVYKSRAERIMSRHVSEYRLGNTCAFCKSHNIHSFLRLFNKYSILNYFIIVFFNHHIRFYSKPPLISTC